MSETGSGGSIAKAANSPSQSGPRIKPNSVVCRDVYLIVFSKVSKPVELLVEVNLLS